MPNILIVKVETVQGDDITTLFDPFEDDITFRLVIELSPKMKAVQNITAIVRYQIIEFSTNSVVFNDTAQMRFNTDEVVWLNAGTADALGLQWNASNLFGFRGAVELYTFDDQGLTAIDDAFDISMVVWFRLKDIFGL